MRQIFIPKNGDATVLELREAPDPQVEKGAVRIRVKASGVNFADIQARMGIYPDCPPLPAVVGYEVAGVIDQVGPGVADWREGEDVIALTRFGGYSDVVVVPALQVFRKPARLSFEEAAGIPVNYLTAWVMLVWLGNIHQGETALVHSVGGGVGQAAVQICKAHGVSVIGTASANKHGRLKEMGVAHCIDYNTQDFAAETKRITDGRGVDIILDAVGGKSFEQSYSCLASLGRLFMFGASVMSRGRTTRSMPTVLKTVFLDMPKFKPLDLISNNRGVFGVNMGHLWHEAPKLRLMMAEMMPKFESGEFTPVLDKTFRFDQMAEAHAYIQARKNFGKVVVVL